MQILIKIIKLNNKKRLPEGKMVFRVLALNSKKGVKTPSWRILGIKNDPQNSNSK